MPTAPAGRLRVGVIGTGFGASTHLPAFARSDDFEVVAIVSGQLANAERVAREAGIDWFSDDYQVMLRDVDLDVVSISAPGYLHYDMVLAAAAAGRHILCEKPFTTSVVHAREMLDAVRQAGVGHAINHEFRMYAARQAFRRMVAEGFLGTVWDVRAVLDLGMLLNPNRGWTWWATSEQYGGMLQAMSSHLIDFLLWTFGDISSLSARLDTFISTRVAADGAVRPVTSDDQNRTLLDFASGASGLLHVSGAARAPRNLIEAHGSAASLSIDNHKLLAAREPGKFEPVEVAAPSEAETPVTLMTAYLRHVARVFRGEADPNVATFEQGVRVQTIMDAIHQSSDEGMVPVRVAE